MTTRRQDGPRLSWVWWIVAVVIVGPAVIALSYELEPWAAAAPDAARFRIAVLTLVATALIPVVVFVMGRKSQRQTEELLALMTQLAHAQRVDSLRDVAATSTDTIGESAPSRGPS